MPTNYLDLELMEKLCHRVAVAVFDNRDDKIPPFEEHEISLLDSALNLPRQTFEGKELYPTLEGKSAVLYYSLIKNHSFSNGNKRIATVSLLTFLYINDRWLDIPIPNLVDLAIRTAESAPGLRAEMLKKIQEAISQNIKSHAKNN